MSKLDPERSRRAGWQTPRGVSAGSWDYIRSGQIAQQYESFLKDDPLTRLDWQIISSYLPEDCSRLVVADFGSGTGRHVRRFLDRGCYQICAIDLSAEMLRMVAAEIKTKNQNSYRRVIPILANLVELDGLADQSVDFGICMFSTMGMIRGATNRNSFLNHVRRILRPGGTFVVHAHNLWFNLRYPGGIHWLVKNLAGALRGRNEFGDRLADYRSIKNMFIHSFSFGDLCRSMKKSGFEITAVHRLTPNGQQLPGYRRSQFLNTIGWVLVCQAGS